MFSALTYTVQSDDDGSGKKKFDTKFLPVTSDTGQAGVKKNERGCVRGQWVSKAI